ncbi:MAG: hypothetical protein V9G23_14965 [Giesbergeria sp.]
MAQGYPDVTLDKQHIDILTRPLRAAARPLRRGGRHQPVWRHPERPGPGHHRHHRPGAVAPT